MGAGVARAASGEREARASGFAKVLINGVFVTCYTDTHYGMYDTSATLLSTHEA
jgi:hypothetical protein